MPTTSNGERYKKDYMPSKRRRSRGMRARASLKIIIDSKKKTPRF
jgi:hypothetical protein